MRLCCVFVHHISLTLMSTYFNPNHNLFLNLTTQFLGVDLSKLGLLHKACLLLSPWQQRSNKPSPLGCLLGNTPMVPIRRWRQSSSLSLFISITRQSCRCHCLTHIHGKQKVFINKAFWLLSESSKSNTFLLQHVPQNHSECRNRSDTVAAELSATEGWLALSVPGASNWALAYGCDSVSLA